MADFAIPFFSLVWAILIICFIISGIWVFFAIRKSFTPVLLFDIVYILMLEALCLGALTDPSNAAELPYYLITFVTFLLDLALTIVILYEWRDAPKKMNEYVWWLKIALSITGLYTVIPLGLYWLKLSYLPRHPVKKKEDEEDAEISLEFPGPVSRTTVRPPAELLDRYTGWKFLGQGGFARVFKVTKKDGSAAALKVPLEYSPEIGNAFIAEIQNWTKLGHDNIVRVIEFNVLPVPFFEMELCESSLARVKKPLAPVAASEVILDICDGLIYCHNKGIIHRDLKPSNILSARGAYKISDWGGSTMISLSGVTASQVMVTPQYAAPEQVLGTAKDHRTDIWQAGVILFEIVTGELPFTGANIVEIFANITTRDPPVPSSVVPAARPLDEIILRCLQRDMAERYPDVEDLRAALAAYLVQEYTDGIAAAIAERDNPAAEWYCCNLLLLALRQEDLSGAVRAASELDQFAVRHRKGAVRTIRALLDEALRDGERKGLPELIRQARALVFEMQEERREREGA